MYKFYYYDDSGLVLWVWYSIYVLRQLIELGVYSDIS